MARKHKANKKPYYYERLTREQIKTLAMIRKTKNRSARTKAVNKFLESTGRGVYSKVISTRKVND